MSTATQQQHRALTLNPETLDAEQRRDRAGIEHAIAQARAQLAHHALEHLPRLQGWKESAINRAAAGTRFFETEPFVHEHLIPKVDVDGLLVADPGEMPRHHAERFSRLQRTVREAEQALQNFDQQVIADRAEQQAARDREDEQRAEVRRRMLAERDAAVKAAPEAARKLSKLLDSFEPAAEAIEIERTVRRVAKIEGEGPELPEAFTEQLERLNRLRRLLMS